MEQYQDTIFLYIGQRMPIILKENEGIINKQNMGEGAYISSKLNPLNFPETLSFQKGKGHNVGGGGGGGFQMGGFGVEYN